MKHDRYMWKEFESNWMNQFQEIVSAIKLINLYPERLHLVYLGNLLHHEDLMVRQKDWIHLYSKFHPIEKAYYKPHHVPINSDDYKTFVDLSKEGYPVFEPLYNAHSNKWFQMNRFDSLYELITYLDSDSIEPPVWDKEFAAQIQAGIDEIDLDEIIREYQKRKKG